MALNLKVPAIREAIQAKLASTRARRSVSARDDLGRIIERGRRRATLDDREADEILGYDDHGLPS